MTDEAQSEDAPSDDPFAGPGWSEQVRRRRARTSPEQTRRRVHGRSRRRRRVLLGSAVFGLLVLVAVGWLTYTALKARTELQAVRAEVATLRSQIAAGDLDGAKRTATALQGHAARAHDLTTGPVWAVSSAVPYLGDPLQTARTISASANDIASKALPPLVDASQALTAKSLREADGTINLAPIQRSATLIGTAITTLQNSLRSLTSASGSTWLGSVNSARSDLLEQLPPLLKTVQNADVAARTVPALLGADGPRSYFVAFQNEAELRGLGGLPGAFAILKADHGKISFTRFESDGALTGTASGQHFGYDYDQLYSGVPGSTTDYLNSNPSPNFPYPAQIWLGMWKQKTGQQLDGAIAVDPTVLSYLLAVSGPTRLADGTTVNASNVVSLTQQVAYDRFGNDQNKRKQFLLNIAKAVSETLIGSKADPTSLVRAATRGVTEHRLLVWTRDDATEQTLSTTPIAGVVPVTPKPYVGLALNNIGVNKLDYYLHAAVDWRPRSCAVGTRDVTVTVTLRNDAPAHLGKYVTGLGGTPRFAPVGVNKSFVQLMTTENSKVQSVTLNGKPIHVINGTLVSRPVYGFFIDIPRKTPQVIVFHLTEPNVAGALQTRLQPMINPVEFSAGSPNCSS